MLRTFEIRDVEQLESYRLAWTALWRAGSQPWFTQSLDWLAAFVRLQSDRVALRALFICDDDEILGIVPLVLLTESSRFGPFRTLRYPVLAGLGCCGPIGSQPTFVLLEAMQYLMRHPTEWDILDLEGIDVEAVDHGRTKTALHVARIPAEVAAWQTRSTISLAMPEDVARMPARMPSVRLQDPRVEYVRYRPEGVMHGDAEPRLELFDDCLAIARAGDGHADSLLHGHAMMRELHVEAARNGTLDVNLLYVDDAPAAFVYGYVCGGSVTVVDAGFDARYIVDQPGEALAAAMMCDSMRRGDQKLDLGVKPRPWLRAWSNASRTIYRAQSKRPSGVASRALRWGKALRRRFGDAAAF
ncbi:MAG: GNAT family N-acetyltransferase [Planctomycetia bacterium]|nr:GNAT family N-acetyltransferase [Planctomycetia bacterium]